MTKVCDTYMDCIFFINLSVDGYLGWSHALSTANRTEAHVDLQNGILFKHKGKNIMTFSEKKI